MKVEAGTPSICFGSDLASCVAMVKPASRVCLVRRLVFGESDVAVDAEHRSLGITTYLRRELRKARIEILDQLTHWRAHLGLVFVAMRLEPGFLVMPGKLPEEAQRTRSEWHTEKISPEQRLEDEQNIRRTFGQAPHVPAVPCRSVTNKRLDDVPFSHEPALRGVANPVKHVNLILVFPDI